MIKLLLAEDEDYIRKGLLKKIQWKGMGIDEVYDAANGIEAYEIASEKNLTF